MEHIACAAVVNGGNGSEGGGVVEVGHHTYFELVFGLRLLDIHAELHVAHTATEVGHGIDAALVEQEAVVAAVSVGTAVINHGLVLVGHSHVLVCEDPAGRLDTSLGGGAVGVGVKVVCVGEVGNAEGAGCSVDNE